MAAIGTRKTTFSLDGDEHRHELTSWKFGIGDADTDTLTFEEADGDGGKDWTLTIGALQDPGSADSITNKIWDFAGTEVPYVLRPYGNAVASITEPHFTGVLVIDVPDGDFLGVEADRNPKGRGTFEVTFKLLAKPTKVTAGP